MEIIYFLKSKLESKFIVFRVIEISGNGYFFEYFRDLKLITFINDNILTEVICSLKIIRFSETKNIKFIEFWESRIEKLFFSDNQPTKLINYLKNTENYDFWNKFFGIEIIGVWLSVENLRALKPDSLKKYFSNQCECGDYSYEYETDMIKYIKNNNVSINIISHFIEIGLIKHKDLFFIAIECEREDLIDYNKKNKHFEFLKKYVEKYEKLNNHF